MASIFTMIVNAIKDCVARTYKWLVHVFLFLWFPGAGLGLAFAIRAGHLGGDLFEQVRRTITIDRLLGLQELV